MTHWRLKANMEEVFEILSDPLGYPNWWGPNHLSAEELKSEDGVSREKPIRMRVRGWLPYTLEWVLVHTEVRKPDLIISESKGDFVGRGIWSLKQEGPETDIIFDWKIRAEKPFLRYFSRALKPLFSANHNWLMEKMRKGLIQELSRRKARVSLPVLSEAHP